MWNCEIRNNMQFGFISKLIQFLDAYFYRIFVLLFSDGLFVYSTDGK